MPDKTQKSRLWAFVQNFIGVALIVTALTRGNDSGVSTALLSHAKAWTTTATASARESVCGEFVKAKCDASVEQALADHAAKYNATNQGMLEILLARIDKSDKAHAEVVNATRDELATKMEQLNTTLYTKLVAMQTELEKLGARINSTAVLVAMPFIAHGARNWFHAYMIWVPFYYCHFVGVGDMHPFWIVAMCFGILFIGADGVPGPFASAATKAKSCLCERSRTCTPVAQTPPLGPTHAPTEKLPAFDAPAPAYDAPAPAYEAPAPVTAALRDPIPSLVVYEPTGTRRRLVLPRNPEHSPEASDNE
jgi:hypothetical protein